MITLNIARLTHNQPFCAGVVIHDGTNLLITLNPDDLPDGLAGSAYRIGGVGGGQEPGETIRECAIREAKEETYAGVELISSHVTYFFDRDTGALSPVSVVDAVAPLLLERVRSLHPDRPYKPGLPIGPYVYCGLYLAKNSGIRDVRPADDVQALVWFPMRGWDWLSESPTVAELIDAGITVIGNQGLDENRRLWLPESESFSVAVKLLVERVPETHGGG